MKDTDTLERREIEFRADEDKIGKSTYYQYKKQYIDTKGNRRKAGILTIENSLAEKKEPDQKETPETKKEVSSLKNAY